MTENENIAEIIMSKMFDEHLQVNIDYEWRKVVCLDDIGSILRRELKGLNEEIQQYRSIGTVSECREAKEKQKPKTPNMWGDGYADGKLVYDMYDCPNCGESYEIDYTDYAYCPKCGQKIDRADLEKMEV